ncbi:MAG: ABC transporter ATP-binding protein [Candidatus Rokuibacteriota bacterium]
MATVDLVGLTKTFGAVRAVDRLTVHIAHGELVSLLGSSGCGKTTTLRLVAGFLRPDEGEIRIDGKLLASPAMSVPTEQRQMSMIFQSYAIWPHRTVYENVAYGLRVRRLPRADIDRKVRDILKVVRMTELAGRYPSELSGGQQQRVSLARALVVEPVILLLDEPLSNLDANLREEMRFEIRRLHDEFQITSLYVTHDQAEAMVTSDRVVVMNRGRIEQVGPPDEIYERPRTRFVAEFVGKTNSLPGVMRRAGLEISPGVVLRVRPDAQDSEGRLASAFVRPHHISLQSPDVGPDTVKGVNTWNGRVIRVGYFGDSADYLVEVPGWPQPLRAIVPPDRRFRLGDVVRLVIEPERCIVIPEEPDAP